jgi:hypothetical protein
VDTPRPQTQNFVFEMRPRGKKYGAPLYAIEWSDAFAYMCGGGNNGIENKYVVVAMPLQNFLDRSTRQQAGLGPPAQIDFERYTLHSLVPPL